MDFEVNNSNDGDGGEKKIKVISVHIKSPFVQNGQQMWKNPDTRRLYVAEALCCRGFAEQKKDAYRSLRDTETGRFHS
jgi:hypothetical protein